MKKYYSILIALFVITLFSTTAFPQRTVKLVFKENSLSCGFSAKKGFFYPRYTTSSYMIVRQAEVNDKSGIYEVIEGINKAIGISTSFNVFITTDDDNARAGVDKNGDRFILADHMFLVQVNKDSGTKWGAVSILAHEVGHHVAGLGSGELDADYWSGYALQKLGASKNASSKAILTYGTEEDTESHPNKYSRKSAIEEGWNDAENGTFDSDRCQSCED